MDLDLWIGNRDVGLVEGEFDIFGQCEFGSEIVSGFRPGTNRQVHTVVGWFKHPYQRWIFLQYSLLCCQYSLNDVV